jgi:mRNA interferase MazF
MVLELGRDPARRRAVNLDLVERVGVDDLGDRLGRVADERMRAVCAALAVWRT